MAIGTSGRTSTPGRGRAISCLGYSEMAEMLLAFDWAATPLGPIASWPQSLTSAVSTCLQSRFQMAIYWGPELNCLYNDAERSILGDLHPDALGMPARELLRDSWEVVGPELEAVIRGEGASWAEDQPLTFNRRGSLETGYFTYSYSAIFNDHGDVGGVLLVSQDTTARVLAERRLDLLRNLSQEDRLRTLLSDLRATQRRVAAAADAERRRIESNLHDGAQQRLMAIRLELGLLEELVEQDPAGTRVELGRLRAELNVALEELRDLAHGLYPPLLASDGLHAALAGAALRAPIPVALESQAVGRMPRPFESAAYFACLEALQNAAKHGGKGVRATVRLSLSPGELTFSVTDDGEGFNVDGPSNGQGLTNLRDRLGAVGGDAEVTSAPGRGTTVLGRIPLP